MLVSHRTKTSRKTFSWCVYNFKTTDGRTKVWPKKSLVWATCRQTTSLIDFLFQTHRFFGLAGEEVVNCTKSWSLYLEDLDISATS